MAQFPILDATKVVRAIEAGYDALSWARESRASHIAAYTGRWFGQKKVGKVRVLALMAQAIHGWLPALTMNNPRFSFKGRFPGLDMQAKLLSSMVNRVHREIRSAQTVYRYQVMEAMLSPYAPSYTGLRSASRLAELNGAFYDPGEPFTLALDFDDWCLDPFAKRLEGRRWEAHRFRMSKQEMLENPQFRDKWDSIRALTPVEQGGSIDTSDMTAEGGYFSGGDALSEQVELWNICIYEGGKIIEGTIPTNAAGAPRWIRLCEYHGPDDGPYDHLSFYPVPGKAASLPPMSVSRDAGDMADDAAVKVVRGMMKSKKLLVYSAEGKGTAEKVMDSKDFDAIRSNSPKDVNVVDLNMVQADMVPLINWVTNSGWNQSSGNPTLQGGTAKISDTATEAEILAARSNLKMADLAHQVQMTASCHARKMAWFFQTDPVMDYEVPIEVPNPNFGTVPGEERVNVVVIPYTAEDRTADPTDFDYECDAVSMIGMDPNMRSARLLQALTAINDFMPLVQMGVGNLNGLCRVLGRNLMVEDLAEIINDPVLIQQAMMAAQEEKMLEQRAGEVDPAGQPMPNPAAMQGQLPSGAAGADPAMNPIQTTQGMRQSTRAPKAQRV